MISLIKKELKLTRKILLIWLGIIILLCVFAYIEYLSLKDSLPILVEMLNDFPRILMVMFGVSEDLNTALGWYGCIYFWVAILAYSYAIYLGISSIAKEKTQGTAEYLFTKPLGRNQIVIGKAAANVCNLFILAAVSGVCNYYTAIAPLGGLDQKNAALLTTVGLFLTEIILSSIGFWVSSLCKSYKQAMLFGFGALIVFYCIYFVAEYLCIPALFYLTPLKYFDVYAVAKDGISLMFLLISGVITFLSIFLAKNRWAGKEM